MNWRNNLLQSVLSSGRKYTIMTTRSAKDERFPLEKKASRDIKDFYDLAHCTVCALQRLPDMSAPLTHGASLLLCTFCACASSLTSAADLAPLFRSFFLPTFFFLSLLLHSFLSIAGARISPLRSSGRPSCTRSSALLRTQATGTICG